MEIINLEIQNQIVKKHYRAVILILASNNNEIYNNCRRIWKLYMNNNPLIKVFFVYGCLNNLENYDETSDIICLDIPESLFIAKTIYAMKLIHESLSYDFFIRTNLSTFWDFEKLLLHLNDLPTINCYSGDGPLNGWTYSPNGFYLSGVDTIVTPEMIESIINNSHLLKYNVPEDMAMGMYFNGILKAPMLQNRICFFEDIKDIYEINKIQDRILEAKNNKKDHYRVKTLHINRVEIDMFIYKELLKSIYNISLI